LQPLGVLVQAPSHVAAVRKVPAAPYRPFVQAVQAADDVPLSLTYFAAGTPAAITDIAQVEALAPVP
jgi:hypothetical protein